MSGVVGRRGSGRDMGCGPACYMLPHSFFSLISMLHSRLFSHLKQVKQYTCVEEIERRKVSARNRSRQDRAAAVSKASPHWSPDAAFQRSRAVA